MNETIFPSRTDLPEIIEPTQAPAEHQATMPYAAPAASQSEPLLPGERTYLAEMEERNRYLTMLLGDKVMEVELAKKTLEDHRQELKESYVSVLRMHGINEGRINTQEGTITVSSRGSKE